MVAVVKVIKSERWHLKNADGLSLGTPTGSVLHNLFPRNISHVKRPGLSENGKTRTITPISWAQLKINEQNSK